MVEEIWPVVAAPSMGLLTGGCGAPPEFAQTPILAEGISGVVNKQAAKLSSPTPEGTWKSSVIVLAGFPLRPPVPASSVFCSEVQPATRFAEPFSQTRIVLDASPESGERLSRLEGAYDPPRAAHCSAAEGAGGADAARPETLGHSKTKGASISLRRGLESSPLEEKTCHKSRIAHRKGFSRRPFFSAPEGLAFLEPARRFPGRLRHPLRTG